MALADTLSGLLNVGGNLAAAYLPYEATADRMAAIEQMASGYSTKAQEAGQQAAEAAQFTPFAIKTGTGTTQVGEGGGFTQTLGQTPAAIQSSLLGQAQTAAGQTVDPTQFQALQQQALQAAGTTLGQTTPTATSLYQEMQAAQAPEIQRQRLELENRLAAQGRLGVGTAMYGGTPEALAMEKAIQEQAAQNMVTAQTLAPQLASQQIQQATGLFGIGQSAAAAPSTIQGQNLANLQSMLGSAYIPQQQELQALQQGAYLSNIAQAAQQGASEAMLGTTLGGLEAEAAGLSAIAGLEGQRATALSQALGGLFASSQGEKSSVDLLIESLLGG